MNLTTLPLEAIRKNLEAKGLSEADIEQVLKITKAANATIARCKGEAKASKPKETMSIGKMLIEEHCPSCQADDSYHVFGNYYKATSGSQSRFVVNNDLDGDDFPDAKVVKSTRTYRMCQVCMRKEQLMTKVEHLLSDPINHRAFEKFISSLGGKE